MKIIIRTVLLFFLSVVLLGCYNSIDSLEYLQDSVEDEMSEIYSVSYNSSPLLYDFIEKNYHDLPLDEIKIKSGDFAMIYGLNKASQEMLIFVPEVSRYKEYPLIMDNEYTFEDVIQTIRNVYPEVVQSMIEAVLLTDADVTEVTESISVVLGYSVIVNGVGKVCYLYYDGQFHSYIIG
jgi:hypothetical protein